MNGPLAGTIGAGFELPVIESRGTFSASGSMSAAAQAAAGGSVAVAVLPAAGAAPATPAAAAAAGLAAATPPVPALLCFSTPCAEDGAAALGALVTIAGAWVPSGLALLGGAGASTPLVAAAGVDFMSASGVLE